jgi:hypothetical protein
MKRREEMKTHLKCTALAMASLLVTSLVVCGTLSTPARAANLVGNPGFETGSLSPWTTFGGGQVVGDNQHSGSYCGRTGTALSSFEQVIGGLSPSTTYTVVAYAKVASGGETVLIGVKDYGSTEQQHPATSTSYQQVTFDFTTGGSNTSAKIFCYKHEGSGYAYCDDFSVDLQSAPTDTPVPPTDTPEPGGWTELTYDDFESGWGSYTDGGGDAYLYTGGTYAHQGSNAAGIQDNSGVASSFYHTVGIDVDNPGYTQIKVEFWFYAYSMDNSSEDFWVQYYDGSAWHTVATYARTTDFDNNVFYFKEVFIDEASYTFPTDSKIRFMCDASGDADDVYIDEVKVSATVGGAPPPTETPVPPTSTPEPNLVGNPGFETGSASPWSAWGGASVEGGNARSGSYAGQTCTSNCGLEQYVSVSPNTTYELRGWARVVNGGESVLIGVKDYGGAEMFEDITATSYTEGVTVFTTGSSNTTATVYCYKMSGGTAYAYCDDYSVVEQ